MGGVCKPLLKVEGTRVIDRQLAVARPIFPHIGLVVAADGAVPAELLGLGLAVITDRIDPHAGPGPGPNRGPDTGPIFGLDAALAWLPDGLDALVCVAGDMPFLSAALLRRLRDHPAGRSLVPRHATGVEPLCARYARAAIGPLARFLAAGGRALHAFVQALDPDYLEGPELADLAPGGLAFTNLNRPSDLHALAAGP
jgi:molybdopterin-guanine dinucleotide biosynthesis protein A